MALKDLLTDLSNFKYTDYGSAGSVQSQVSGRHGTPDAPIDNSDFDNGVGFGQDPNSTPQSFNVRGYTITGNKRFIVNYGGDIIGEDGSIYGMGEFNSILTPFDHTQMRDTSRVVYNQYSSVPFGDSRHTSDDDVIGAIGGGVSYYGNLLPITPRGSIYRDSSGNYQVPQEGGNTLPPGGVSGIVGFTGDQVTFNIPQHISTGPEQFDIEEFSDVPLVPNAHGSGFMNQLPYQSLIQNKDTLTHNVSMINLTGPTTDVYQTTLNTQPIAVGAHGSDFDTTPIQAYSSIFSNADGTFGLLTSIDSQFSPDEFYVDSSNRGPTSFGTFKQFNRGDTPLKRISLDSPNFDSDGDEEFTFRDSLPYNLDPRDNSVFGFDQPFILKDIGDSWGPGGLGSVDEGIVRGGIVTSIARGIADGLRITKFLLTPKGIAFGVKQALLQGLNPRAETRLFNPLSIGSGNTTAAGVPLRIDRHLDGGTYEEAIGDGFFGTGDGSILDQYGDAVVSSAPGIGLTTTTAKRVTFAHLGALVPSAGGKVALPAIPEISADLLSGNIRSLSSNTFPDTDGIGNDIPNSNKYGRGDKGYVISIGNGIIPARDPQAGFSDGLFGSRFAGSPLTEKGIDAIDGRSVDSVALKDVPQIQGRFTNERYGPLGVDPRYEDFAIRGFNEDFPIIIGNDGGQPSAFFTKIHSDPTDIIGSDIERLGGQKTLRVDSQNKDKNKPIQGNIIVPGLFERMFDEFDSPYLGETNFIGAENEPPKAFMIRSFQDSRANFNPLISADERSTFQSGLASTIAFEPLSESYPAELQIRNRVGQYLGDTYSKDAPYLGVTKFLGGAEEPSKVLLGRPFQDSRAITNPLIAGGEDSTFQDVPASTIAYEPLSESYPAQLQIRNRTGQYTEDTYSQEEPYADRPSIFIGDKTMLVMGGSNLNTLQLAGNRLADILDNKISVKKKSAFTHDFANERVTAGKDSVLPYNEDLFYGNYTSLAGGKYETNPERFQDGQADSSLIKQLGVVGSIGVDRTTLFGGDTNNSGGRPEEQQIFTISDADTNQFSKDKRYLGRIEVDGKNNFKSIFFGDGRLNGDPSVDFKTQYVDTDKFQRGGASPQQGPFEKRARLQDFPFINGEDGGGNYGNEGQALGFLKGGGRKDNHGDNFYGTDDGRLAFGTSRYSQQVGDGSKYQPGVLEVPSDTKRINYQHNVAEVQEGDIGENSIEASFPANENLPNGDINRYRTLAYGQLPKSRDTQDANNYSKRVIESDDNQPVPPQLDSQEVPEFRAGIGLVKISSDRASEAVSFLDKLDLANLTEYGEDYTDDYIKFKFFDTINKKYIIFPATLSGISDSITPEWSSEKYIGRPDQVHVYTGTTRELSFSFKIGIMSKQQLLVCWEKLNYLIGLTYPTWKTISNSERMEAPFMELTIGDMFNRTPGFINSLSYSIDDTTPWDIDEGTQLPKSIDVEVTFTHIGRHKLASQGKHFDLPWLRNLETVANPDVENSVYRLGARPTGFGSVFKNDGSAEAVGGVQSDG